MQEPSTPKFRVVVVDLGYKNYDPEREELSKVDAELILRDCKSEEDLIEAVAEADALLVRQAEITARVIRAANRCKVIGRYGIGVDNVDLKAATEKGVMVVNVPDYCQDEVSDHALGLLLACARRIVSRDRKVRAGAWDIGAREPIFRMRGKTLGVLGLGSIARTLVRKVKGFELRVIAYDPFLEKNVARDLGVELVELDELFRQSDYLSIHAPLTETSHHIVNEQRLRSMKPTAIIVNTSRGPLIDEEALIRALQQGWIASAGLDVYEKEPLPSDSPLRTLENVVLTDHTAWYSEEATVELQHKAAAEVARVLAGEKPMNLVNREVLDKLKS